MRISSLAPPQTHCNQLVIDRSALQHNIAALRLHLPSSTRIMVVVKAEAYGVMSKTLCHFLSEECGIDYFGVATVAEGIQLRKEGVLSDIFVIHATPKAMGAISQWGLEIALSTPAQVEAAAAAATVDTPTPVHLHIDTGMHRLGCAPSEALALGQAIVNAPSLELRGAMTHLAAAEDETEDAFTRQQYSRFSGTIATLRSHGISPPYTHIAASSGAIRFPEAPHNLVRIGLALYGVPQSNAVAACLPLRNALTLTSSIAEIATCAPGETVGYGRTYRVASPPQRIATLPIGYHDGLARSFSPGGGVLIRGVRAPFVGSICMDFCMVDVTHIPEAAEGDTALFFGTDGEGHTQTVDAFARQGNTIPHVLLSCLGPRIARHFV